MKDQLPRTTSKETKEDKVRVDRLIFVGALILIFGLTFFVILAPDTAKGILGAIGAFNMNELGWFYLIATFAALIFTIYVGFSDIGKIKMGAPNEKPEYSTFSWIAMLFCAGQGSSIIYWGTIEWGYYMLTPPPGYAPMSVEAADVALSAAFLHWGPSTWALYLLPTLGMTYLYWRRRDPILRLSLSLGGVIPNKVLRGKTGSVIDLIILFVIVVSYVATLGLGTPMIATGLEYFFNIPQTIYTQIAIVAAWSLVFGTSVYRGLDRGIQSLSRLNAYIAFFFLGLVFVLGNPAGIMNKISDTFANLLHNYCKWSLFTDSLGQSGFAQSWTIFYFAWVISACTFMGLWVARISRGRTIREIVCAELIVCSSCAFTIFGVLGSYGIRQQMLGGLDIVNVLETQGPTYAVVYMLTSLPLGKIVLALMLITMFINLATSLDSTAFVLAQLSCNNLKLGEEPPRWWRMFWAAALVTMPIGLILVGADLATLQSFILTPALPTTIFLILMAVYFYKKVKEDKGLSYRQIVINPYKKNKPEVSLENVNRMLEQVDEDTNDNEDCKTEIIKE